MAALASGAKLGGFEGADIVVGIARRRHFRFGGGTERGLTQESSDSLKLFRTIAVGEKSVVADAHETLGENVEKESSEELDGVESHGALTTALGVVLVAEADFAVVDAEQSLVGDGDPVGIAGEVFEDLPRSTERRLSINDPVFVTQGFEQSLPGFGMLEVAKSTVELKLFVLEGVVQVSEKLSSKQPTENADREKEPVSTAHPALAIEAETAASNHAMQMRMGVKGLSPGVENGEAAELRAQELGVSAEG